jgi:hypothetical protein
MQNTLFSAPPSSRQPAAYSLFILLFLLAACAPLPQRAPRASHSSFGCMTAALRDRLPSDLPDVQAHCMASALIARYCSVSEATMAGWGKELKDLLGPGDAEWRDLRSDRRGITCARAATTEQELLACCLR